MSIPDASSWASEYLKKTVTPSNISYLVQYAQIRKAVNNGAVCVYIDELKEYYDNLLNKRVAKWGAESSENTLAFANLRDIRL
jgi:hypothetical protein